MRILISYIRKHLHTSLPVNRGLLTIRVLLKAIQHGISKTALAELTLRSHQSTLQQLIELGMITVGAEDDSSSTVIWLNKKISSAKLSKKRFLDVLPLIEFGWHIDGFDLTAPDW